MITQSRSPIGSHTMIESTTVGYVTRPSDVPLDEAAGKWSGRSLCRYNLRRRHQPPIRRFLSRPVDEEITRRVACTPVTGAEPEGGIRRSIPSVFRSSRAGELAGLVAGSPVWIAGLLVAILSASVLLLYLGRDLTFFGDEWTFLDERMVPSVDAWLRPHNEHWSSIPVIAYQVFFRIFGLQSYQPYLALLVAVHMITVCGVYRLVSALAGRPTGFAAAVVLVLVGPAFEDLFWAFQVGFIGATAAGVWALVVMRGPPDRWHRLSVGLLLVVAVSTSGVGLFFLAAALVEGLLRRDARGFLPVLMVIVAIYGTWYLVYGRSGGDPLHPPFSLPAIVALPAFVWHGVAAAFGAASASGVEGGRVLAILFVAAVAWAWLRGRTVPPLVTAALAGLTVEFVLIGSTRAYLGPGYAAVSRYLYPAVVLVLIAIAAALGPPRSWLTARRRLVLVALALIVMVGGLAELRAGRDYMLAHARETRAVLEYARTYDGLADVPDDRSLFPLPTVGRLRELVAAAGDPSVAAGGRRDPAPTASEQDRALLRVAGGAFRAVAPRGDAMAETDHLDHRDVTLASRDDGCLTVQVVGATPWVTVEVPDGGGLLVAHDVAGAVAVALGRFAPPRADDAIHITMSPHEPVQIVVPNLLDDILWQVRVDPSPAASETVLCVLLPPEPG